MIYIKKVIRKYNQLLFLIFNFFNKNYYNNSRKIKLGKYNYAKKNYNFDKYFCRKRNKNTIIYIFMLFNILVS